MKKLIVAAALAAMSAGACAGEITLFSDADFRGSRLTLNSDARDLSQADFNDRASSIKISSGSWRVCERAHFRGGCATLGPGEYRKLPFNDYISSVQELGEGPDANGRGVEGRRHEEDRGGRGREGGHGRGRHEDRGGSGATLFEDRGFGGRRLEVEGEARDLARERFNDRASSLIVREGRWILCEHANFAGRCQVYGPGRHEQLGMNDKVSSLRELR
jgi:hypothetical protein